VQKITYVKPDGTDTVLDVAEGQNLMMAAIAHNLPGIIGECGGHAMCATCHVYVDPDQLDSLPDVQDEEDEMLEDVASERRPNSRLSCQLVVADGFDGLRVELPEAQV